MPAPPLPPRPRPRQLASGAPATDARASADDAAEALDTASGEKPVLRMAGQVSGSFEAEEAAEDGRVFDAGKLLAGKYVLERPAGFGGMAELWVATNQATGAEVCVKLLIPRGDEKAEAVERFQREARAAAKLSHRAIVRVFDLLELDEHGEATTARPRAYAIVMELLHGETLGDLLAKRDKLPIEEALDLFLPVLSALAHAHRASVIHRDIKPDNIFLARDPDGQVIPKVLDFGVSKLENAETITIDGVLVGTPSFMSPEQARGARTVDARSDVFSAGILLYMMLTGQNPFEGGPFASVVDAVLRREVPPLEGLAPEIWAVLDKAISKDPAQRYNDATEMAIALRQASGRKASTESSPMLPAPASSSRSVDVSAAEHDGPASSDDASSPRSAGASGAPSSVTMRPEDVGAKRRRAIVAGVVGTCALLALVAAIGSLRSGATERSAPPSTGVAAANAGTTVEATPAPATAAPVAVEAPPSSEGEAAPAASAAEDAKPAETKRREPRARGKSPKPASTAAPRGRKPGQEPASARGPGF